MKIYTNEGNPLGLKLLLAAKFAKKDVQIKIVTLNGKNCFVISEQREAMCHLKISAVPVHLLACFHLRIDDASILKVIQHFPSDPALKEPKHLPSLELDSGAQLFMSDAAVKYLMSGVEEESDVSSQVSD